MGQARRAFALVVLATFACDPEDPPPRDPCPGGDIVKQVTGTVVNEHGAPFDQAYAQMCVLLPLRENVKACLRPVQSTADGAFDMPIDPDAQCMAKPAVRITRPQALFAATYCAAPPDPDSTTLAVEAPLWLYELDAPTVKPALGAPEETRTLVWADGLEIDWTPSRYFGPLDGYDYVGARREPLDSGGLCFLQPDVLEGVYALGPEGELKPDGFEVRIPNTTGIAANATVPMYVLAGLGCVVDELLLESGGIEADVMLDSGEWVHYGNGTVDATGAHITARVPCLTWIGWGPAQ